MDLPTPHALAALAYFLRDRLVDVGDTIAPLLPRPMSSVIIAASAPFAPTSYSRARLMRQMHASGLLSADEATRVGLMLDAGSGSADGNRPTSVLA